MMSILRCQIEKLTFYASERSTFSFIWATGSADGSWVLSESDGWDSSLAAACNTRFWTSMDEGDVGSPGRFVSIFPAAHENAWPPSLTGVSSSLQRLVDNKINDNITQSFQNIISK